VVRVSQCFGVQVVGDREHGWLRWRLFVVSAYFTLWPF
jgi:hypothetical protein